MPEITGIAHVELSVSHLEVSVAWYGALLEAREVFRETDEGQQISAVAVREPRSGVILAFTEHRRQEGGAFTPRRAGLDHLSFGVASEEALEAWRLHLDALGIDHSPVRDYGFGLAITCSDPDGIALEFLWARRRPPPP